MRKQMFHFYLDAKNRQWLEREAKRRGESMAEIIRQALDAERRSCEYGTDGM